MKTAIADGADARDLDLGPGHAAGLELKGICLPQVEMAPLSGKAAVFEVSGEFLGDLVAARSGRGTDYRVEVAGLRRE